MADDARPRAGRQEPGRSIETPSGPFTRRLAADLARLEAEDLTRRRRTVEADLRAIDADGPGMRVRADGRKLVDFCANDYLGLAREPQLRARVAEAAHRLPVGAGAAALVSGFGPEHAALEEALADFWRVPRDAVLLFSSGWAANLGCPRALVGRGGAWIADELNHASLIDGGRLSGAAYVRVPHADAEAFARAAETFHVEHPDAPMALATDGVFSMDGDAAPLYALAGHAARHGAVLYVDDAHGLGVVGEEGRGSLFRTSGARLAPDTLLMAGFGKSLGVAGAAVAGPPEMIDWLVQKARTFVFSTATPPLVAHAARLALEHLRQDGWRRERLAANVARFRRGAVARGLALLPVTGPIQPLLAGDGTALAALGWSARLRARGHWVAAIRPPTVPTGTARLRVTLSALHREAEIDALLDALAETAPGATASAAPNPPPR